MAIEDVSFCKTMFFADISLWLSDLNIDSLAMNIGSAIFLFVTVVWFVHFCAASLEQWHTCLAKVVRSYIGWRCLINLPQVIFG